MKKKSSSIQAYEFLRKTSKITSLLYLVYGPDEFQKEQVLSYIKKSLVTKETEDFDFTSFYGNETSGEEIIEQLEMIPFMSKYRLIFLKNYDKLKKADLELLSSYCNSQNDSSVLVLTAVKPDMRLGLSKKIKKQGILIECKSPYSPRDIASWLNKELSQIKIKMESRAISLFSQIIETDYQIAKNELDKLMIYIGNKKTITYEDVLNCVGNSRVNSIFEFQNSIGNMDKIKSFKILDNLINNKEVLVFIIVMLNRFFIIIWKIQALRVRHHSDQDISSNYLKEITPYFRKDYLNYSKHFSRKSLIKIFQALTETDFQIKSTNIEEKILSTILLERIFLAIGK
jgi:DNA polymerase-3 subunit delta